MLRTLLRLSNTYHFVGIRAPFPFFLLTSCSSIQDCYIALSTPNVCTRTQMLHKDIMHIGTEAMPPPCWVMLSMHQKDICIRKSYLAASDQLAERLRR